ncbi:hypothetical protein TeGR_g8190 [Tetraparma gracilis]|uniref:Glycoside hydrolase family 5 domain-containing protein n=1 Tax=Tetraparma gracilis TaxID=2962635 RepID=A0ABQ6MIC9_9STRA|nr:hypothetical protein TeGR_g8190 [Tetraparma gracilis]
MKGAPFIPSTNSSTACPPLGSDGLCDSFSAADAKYFQSQGWNLIRLGVIWAGGQPTLSHHENDELDADFKARLLALLDLAHEYDLRVVLDIHQDAIGTSVCGEGLPLWYFQEHLPHLMGKPLIGFDAHSPTGECSMTDFSGWAKFKDDPEYNTTMAHLIGTSAGRSAYARYVGVLTEAVADSPAAVGIELMNEPPILNFRVEEHKLYDLYKECYDAVRAVSDEMAVGVADAGQIPKFTSDEHLSRSNKEWLEEATHLMYTFHWYSSGFPEFDPAMANGVARAKYFDAVPVLTEFHWNADQAAGATEAGVMWTYYQYNGFCSIPAAYSADSDSGCEAGQECAFGACIT